MTGSLRMQCGVALLLAVQAAGLTGQLSLPGRKKAPPPFVWTVRPEWVRAHEEFLASDALQGRGSATRDEEIAANYVASEFLGFGLTPAPGSTGFLQAVDVIAPVLDGKATLAAGGVVLTEGQDMQLLFSPGVSAVGPLQRISAAQLGKTAVRKDATLIVTQVPKDANPRQLFQAVRNSGAALVLLERSDGTQAAFDQLGGTTRVPMTLKDGDSARGPTIGAISGAAAKGLDSVREGAMVTLTIRAEVKPRATYNAIGFLAGSDPASGTILLTAHLDHLGVGAPVAGDAIYNGANDDAAGTTAVLELARAMAAGPKLRRSVLFVCYGSEEAGELGSAFFGKHSPVPLKDLVANLAFEMIGNQDPRMPMGVLLLTGWDRSNLGATLKEHGAKLGPDPYPEQHFFERSDNYQLALEGVVAHTAAGWGTPPTYHQPSDDLAHLDLVFMTSAIQSLVDPLRWFASSDFKPAWFAGMQPKAVNTGEAMGQVETAVQFARDNGARFVEELKDLLRIPSVSTLPEHAADVRRAAEFCAAELRRIGMENVRLIETSQEPSMVAASEGPALVIPGRLGHPLVLAEWMHAAGVEGKPAPTVLCYGHYDVQPAEPLDEWLSPPFEPAERDGNLYARGAVDDKGQMWMHVKALESLFAAGRLPVNVKVILEGEEEVGGEGIARFLREHGAELKADVALVSDTEMFAAELPTLCVGLRGMIYTEIEARGARTDLHSGMYGGAAPNPLVALAQVIARLKDAQGSILIPGFYDKVQAPTADELAAWKQLPFDEEHYRQTEVGCSALTGEPGFSVMERTWARPTLDVHGIAGGFTGAGAKTVIPAKAIAKVSLRLVPDMTPAESFAQLKAFVETLVPRGIQMEVRLIHSGDPIVVSTDNRYVRAAVAAMREVFGKETVFVRGGGSIPVVGDFVHCLKVPTVLMGFGLPDDNLHAPNEKFNLANFHRGVESIVRFLGGL